MEKELPLGEQSIKQIYLDSQGKKTYVIPVNLTYFCIINYQV